ncbi:hypothetical protein AVEN_137143-1 [Araneus ventricosus]|uniref:Uncharacterized protein n=1 Tax=Araneus ventricosus TaxID=182803 RepID=A0A4Y2KQQ6_ARAVE|nr:hypothetical protein AVEN_137143-1 [Araneus ventricosus]
MESRFPAMLVLWLGREFYRGKYGMTGNSQAWTPDLGYELGDHFGDLATKCGTSKVLEFSRYLYWQPRSGFIHMIPCDVTACHGDYKRTVRESQKSSLC